MKVTIVEYSPAWRELFEQEKQLLETALGNSFIIIEHVGSTSVVGLAAKPIIDIMIGLPDFSVANNLVPKVEALGYEYVPQYEDEMPYRRYFRKTIAGIKTHHIHMVEIGSEFWERHLLFRDFLSANPGVADEYAALKRRLAELEWDDVNEYADAKTAFIRSIESRAREQREAGDAT